MPNSYSWLCQYAIAQIGRPYWYATAGQIASPELYSKTVLPALQGDGLSPYGAEREEQIGKKVHDCSGLVMGALTCDTYDDPPSHPAPKDLEHSATAQFNKGCTSKGTMTTFAKIPGMLLFRASGKYMKHVGIYIGHFIGLDGKIYNEAVIDARSHKSGVVVAELSAYSGGWTHWGRLKDCRQDTDQDTVFDANVILAPPSSVTVTSKRLEVDPTKLTPFIATVLAGYNPTIDYQKIVDARISGMMFYGGQLYDAGHQKQQYYIDNNLANQIKQCNTAGMPYALYVNVRAQNVIEADEECRALYYLISRYPPKLGLWLSLQTKATIKSVNDAILEIYYRYIFKWGLSSKCGLYVTPQQLSTLNWDSFKDRFYLWMIDSMDAGSVDDDLLQPEMFEVPD